MVKLQSYDLLKSKIIQTIPNDELEDLKEILSNDICSTRNRSRIRSIEDLIDYLERNDALSEYNIDALRKIIHHKPNAVLEDALESYRCPAPALDSSQLYNQYRELRLQEELTLKMNLSGLQQHHLPQNGRYVSYSEYDHQSHFNAPPQPPPALPAATLYPAALTERKRAAIYKVIAENIGKFWRSFGRELQITQGKMDELEDVYPRDLVSRVYKLLSVFEEDDSNDPKRHVLTICRALDDCRRKDLRRKIEDIMSH